MSVYPAVNPNDATTTDTDGGSEIARGVRRIRRPHTRTASSHPADDFTTTDYGSSSESHQAIPGQPSNSWTSSSESSSPIQFDDFNEESDGAELNQDFMSGEGQPELSRSLGRSSDGSASLSEESLYPRSSVESLLFSGKLCHAEIQTENVGFETFPSEDDNVLQIWAEKSFQRSRQISLKDPEQQPLMEDNLNCPAEEVETVNPACAGICGFSTEVDECDENGQASGSAAGKMSYRPSGKFALYYDKRKRYFITTTKPPVPATEKNVLRMVYLSSCKTTIYKLVDISVWWLMVIAVLANVGNVGALFVDVFVAGFTPSDRSLAHSHLYAFLGFNGSVVLVCFVRWILSVWCAVWCFVSLKNKKEVLCRWLSFWKYDNVVYIPHETSADIRSVGEYLELKLIETKPSAGWLAILLKTFIFMCLPIFALFEVIITFDM